ncbi:MAG: CAP domain-containing protein [Sulfurovum sp.]|nr:CAP domain-containing protein [Sulfurovum sp.]
MLFFRAVYVSIVIFVVSSGTIKADNASDALNYLNTLRKHSGLVGLKSNALLQKAAVNHARYLIRHQNGGHYERLGMAGFTGVTPSDRVVHAGYASKAVMENVSVNTSTAKESIDTLFAAIYHRFVFLNFDKDEIGIGYASKKAKKGFSSSYVYDLGSTAANALCKTSHPMQNGIYYLQNICKNTSLAIPQSLYEQKENEIRFKNNDIVVYPYANQRNIPPVFFDESPDPLPEYKVSGFPVSVQFNPAVYHQVKLKRFQLYDAGGQEIKRKKILTRQNDIHRRFTAWQFALMPLQRLEYGRTYRVEFEALCDGKNVKRSWNFSTLTPEGKLYKITKKQTTLKVKKGEKIIFYFEPKHPKDLLECVSYTTGVSMGCIDQNTLWAKVPSDFSDTSYTLNAGSRSVKLLID